VLTCDLVDSMRDVIATAWNRSPALRNFLERRDGCAFVW
jgi:hypothetical protein